MRCPYCKRDRDRVVDSRSSDDGRTIRRRRHCVPCGRRFTTYERVEERPLRVVKKDGRREPYDRGKILAGLAKACEKRPIPVEKLDAVVHDIELQIFDTPGGEISTRRIGELVMKELRELDQVAYVRFASVYREFKDLKEFIAELQPMMG
jgi:transcriptional repressor NrdR